MFLMGKVWYIIYAGIFWLIVFLHIIPSVSYLIVLNDRIEPGTIIFNASLHVSRSKRIYEINARRTAQFVHHLFKVDHVKGQLCLKKHLKCDGIYHPNTFTIHIDTLSNYSSIDYYSLPLRIYLTGESCDNDRKHRVYSSVEFDTKGHPFVRRYKRDQNNNSTILAKGDYTNLNENYDDAPMSKQYPSISNRKRGEVYERLLVRKSRAVWQNIDMQYQNEYTFAKQTVTESYASYVIHITDNWEKFCLKKSQFVNTLNAFLPRSICQHCKINFLDINDDRFKIETKNRDLVASRDFCISEPTWEVIVTFRIQCNRTDFVDVDHRLRIVYSYEELDDSESERRVRRELKNQSPAFDKHLYEANTLEEQPPGMSVITVRAHDPKNSEVVYSMVSLLDSRSQSMFKMDSQTGQVTTSLKLDRELMDVHYFRVVATDDGFPPRSGTSTLRINVLDCNDHSPTFEMEQFTASIREGASVGSTVITVRATDQDFGKNADIRYDIESITGGGLTSDKLDASTFNIDGRTGVISTRSTLDRESSEVYTLIVIASDMAPMPSERKTATATVVVKILDDNDNYPQFSEKAYTVKVDEDKWDETNIIAQIHANDADEGINAAIRYAIIGGNVQSQFAIDSVTGDVSLVKPLDYENVKTYRLVIRAQDGGNPPRSNSTNLLVNVNDVNDNAPRFYTSQFQESILENVPVGCNVIRVQAYDSDEGVNAEITYSIVGQDSNFPLIIDPRTGWIQTKTPLDREERPLYSFEILAVDGGDPPKSASTSVVITVQDVNDNDPVFQPKYYEASIAEDQPPGTAVTTVTAVDSDEDSRLHYEITSGNVRGRFSITSQNGKGLITVAQTLDYKQEKRFRLIVTATDSGGRTDTANVVINITDSNNFSPIFENTPYITAVFEDAPIGTTVHVVSASDGDVGINAQITYSLINEKAKDPFAINPQTGAIVTTAALDRESTSGFLITVVAKDGGNPSLSDTTDVEITITDINDNAPKFKVPMYQASISEDALIGTSVVQVSATDVDTGLNGRVKYLLSNKDIADGSFIIDATSGTIRTNKGLDRETEAIYYLAAIAVDKGTPALSSSVEVQIRIEDINDSPPTFASDKIVLYIPENSPVGSLVGEIYAHDPDEGANAIVQYSIIGGDDSNAFSLVTRPGSDRAQLLTMTELDFESSRKHFELIVRASSPPLRSDAHVEVLVTDVNDNAPILKDFQVIFNNFQDNFPSGDIGRVPAFDADVTDKLTYRILSGNNANLIRLNSSTGALTLSPQLNTNVPKFATMEVSVNDGINEAKATMQLTVRLITDEILSNSITVRLNEMTVDAFLSPLLNFFLDGLAVIIPCPKENIYLFSIRDDTDVSMRVLNVSFSARRPDVSDELFYTPQYLQEKVYLNREILARLATVEVLPFDDNLCVREPCLNFEQCLTVLKFANATEFIHSDTVLFRPIYPVNTFACECPEGFTGSTEHYLCDTEVDLCYSDPCQNGGKCIRREGGVTCVCTANYTGANCETDINKTDQCTNDRCDGPYSCLHATEFEVLNSPLYTSSCELRARSFIENSFLTFESMRQRHRFSIKMKFATMHDKGLLLYNGRYNELHDFIALEILNGQVAFSFSLGDNVRSLIVNHTKSVSDGQWHTVEVIYVNRTATVILDGCDTALALRKDLGAKWNCANQTTLVLDRKCLSLTESCHRFLDLTGPLQIGGLATVPTHYQIQARHFVGCIAELEVDNRFVDLNSYIADNGTIAGCPQKASFCGSDPCFNGATCQEGWTTHICKCPEGFTGNLCHESVSMPWRFAGDSVLSFNPLLRPVQLPWLTGVSIKTLLQNAFIIQIQVGFNSSATITLKDGLFTYIYNGESFSLRGIDLADGEWHRLEVKWLGMEIQLSVDYGQRTASQSTKHNLQGLYVGKISIGRPDDGTLNDTQISNFVGCIQDVRIGGSKSVLNRPTVRENVLDGCVSKAQCSVTCQNHSSCVESWDETHCECIPGYIGPDCVPICTVRPCAAGICRVNTSEPKNYRCECNSTIHSGEYCEINVQPSCPSGWWGERSCGPCNCNTDQGYHPDCNKTTGQCYCKDNHYQPPNETACLPCDCYAIGSYNSNCNDMTGQCECREGVIGRRCDSCSSSYAEVTLNGCVVVYDACPRSFAAGVWWPRTPFGEMAFANCPLPARGKGSRNCDPNSGGWSTPDMFNCTSEPFLELRKQLTKLERKELVLNSFVSVKMTEALRSACVTVSGTSNELSTNKKEKERHEGNLKLFSVTSEISNNIWANELGIDYLHDEIQFNHGKLYGTDILIAQGILRELIEYEIQQSGLNLSHSQDKNFIKNLVESAGVILDEIYLEEWRRVSKLTKHGPNNLIDTLNKYMTILAYSQHDTYTNPFEIIHQNMAMGLDIVTPDSLFGYEPKQLTEQYKNVVHTDKMTIFTIESKPNPDTSGFFQQLPKQQPTVSFPKYNNYLQDKNKFDKHTKFLLTLGSLGIRVPDNQKDSVHETENYRAIVSYAQYRDAGALFPEAYDETITKRWGVNIRIATPVLSLAILVPNRKAGLQVNKSPDTSPNAIELFNLNDGSTNTVGSMSEGIKIVPNNNEEHIEEEEHNRNFYGDYNYGAKEVEEEENEDEAAAGAAAVAEKEINIELEREREREINTHLTQVDGQGDNYYGDRKLVKRRADQITESLEQTDTKYKLLESMTMNEPIKLQMWIDMDNRKFSARSNPQCIRWNTYLSTWTRLGCQTEVPNFDTLQKTDDIVINCSCTHISNYAVLVDVIDPEDIPKQSFLVQIASYSSFLLALPMLLCVLIALTLLRGMQTNSNTIHRNIVLCVFFAEFLFFIGMQFRRTLIDFEFQCKFVAICLHYFWLAAFAWTTVDCVHLYRMLTEMRDINHGSMGFYFTLGYGAPAIIVGLSVGVRAHEYGNSLFCWLSVYEHVVWWLVGPIAGMNIVNLLILAVSIKAAFTLKDHVLGYGNLRTLLWLSVISMPLMGVMWILAILAASDNSELLNILLSAVVLLHAIFCFVGYCFINKRVKENLNRIFLKCMGRKVPLLDSTAATNNSTTNFRGRDSNFLAGNYDTLRRNVGISASSTTSRSTAKTSSSPYRSDGQMRHTSTSTSNYNSGNEAPYYKRSTEHRMRESSSRHRKDSDSCSETDGRSVDLASSHSSDDEESRVDRSSKMHRNVAIGVTPGYLPNITEHVQASTPPELNVVQSPQLFPSVNKIVYASRWSSQLPEEYLPSPTNVGRWSQDTASDNEIHSHETSSPNPLPNPDLSDTTAYLHHPSKMNMSMATLENIQHMRGGNSSCDNLHIDRKPTPDNFGIVVNRLNTFPDDYNNQAALAHLKIKPDLPCIPNESMDPDLYTIRENYSFKSPHPYTQNIQNVHNLLKNDYHQNQQQQRTGEYYSDRMSEGSDKNGYHFPYTAEEDHLSMFMLHNNQKPTGSHIVNDINNPGILSRTASSNQDFRTLTPPSATAMHAINSVLDTSEQNDDEEETNV